MGRSRYKRGSRLGTFGQGHTIPLPFELLQSDAWKALTHAQRVVLVEAIREYMRASKFDTEPLDRGFVFVWNNCESAISERAFREAIHAILEVGFLAPEPEFDTRPGMARRFLPSRMWAKYRLNGKSKLAMQCEKKAERLKSKNERLKKFRDDESRGDAMKNQGAKKWPTTPAKKWPTKSSTPGKKVADKTPKTGKSYRQKSGRSDSYTMCTPDFEPTSDFLTELRGKLQAALDDLPAERLQRPRRYRRLLLAPSGMV